MKTNFELEEQKAKVKLSKNSNKLKKNKNRNFIFSPEWLAGFTQTDGSFVISFEATNNKKGLPVRPVAIFNLSQSNKELDMFVALQQWLNVGKVYRNREGVIFVVKDIKSIINVILPLFDQSLLRGGKFTSYIQFKKIVLLMAENQHLNLKGLLKIVDLGFFMNPDTTNRTIEGKAKLLESLKSYAIQNNLTFEVPESEMEISKIRPLKPLTKEFVRGLVDGDGSFNFAFVTKQRKINSNFTLTHELASLSVLYELQLFFQCGYVNQLPTAAARYQVQNLNSIMNNIIPVFQDMEFNTRRQEHFLIFKEVCEILKNEGIKTDSNLRRVVNLAWEMNDSGRRKLTKSQYIQKFTKK